MSDARQIEADIYERLSKVIDPELGRSVTDLGMIAAIEAAPASSDLPPLMINPFYLLPPQVFYTLYEKVVTSCIPVGDIPFFPKAS